LLFDHEATGQVQLTLAGEDLLAGRSPVEILKHQILTFQYPSPYSIATNSRNRMDSRFRIRPFRFLLRILSDPRIGALKIDEIAKIIIVEAENESDNCYEHVVQRLLEYRVHGDACLPEDFSIRYGSSNNTVNLDRQYEHLEEIADTCLHWLEYTQLVICSRRPKIVYIPEEKITDVVAILSTTPPFIEHPERKEYFQRKYGRGPYNNRDNRNFLNTETVTPQVLIQRLIQAEYLKLAAITPITRITQEIINRISENTGFNRQAVEETLSRLYPHGSIGAFMSEYYSMAFSGTTQATNFEIATSELFREVFGFTTRHVGPIGLTPDVLILSDTEGYQAILDNKAYAQYSINNDHRNRMVRNYIRDLRTYSDNPSPLAFFSYIAGGFGPSIDNQIQSINTETQVSGSAVPVNLLINMVQIHIESPYSHGRLRDIFSLNRKINSSDIA